MILIQDKSSSAIASFVELKREAVCENEDQLHVAIWLYGRLLTAGGLTAT